MEYLTTFNSYFPCTIQLVDPFVRALINDKVRRIQELDGLRGIAILLVLGCHYEGFSGLFWGLPKFGWIGVDLFFALSGYLITANLIGLRGRTKPYTTFYARRITRIFPAYVVMISIVGAARIVQHKMYVGWVWTQLFFLQGIDYADVHALRLLFANPRDCLVRVPSLLHAAPLPYSQAGAPLSILIIPYVLWSLSIEEYFYVLWAPTVLVWSRVTVLCIGFIACLGEILLRWLLASPRLYYSIPFRFDALLYGAFLAMLLNGLQVRGDQTKVRFWLTFTFCAAVGGLAVILCALRPVLDRDPRVAPLFLVFGLPALSLMFASLIGLCVLRANSNWWFARLLRSRPLQFLGTISYTMYLVHLLAGAAVRVAFKQQNEMQQTSVEALLATALTVILAQLSWSFLELPMLRWKDRRFPNSPHPPEPNSTLHLPL